MRTDIDAATAAAVELATMIRTKLPVECGTKRWPALGWALLARAAGTTETIVDLTPDGRSTDAGCLVRVLFEHVVTFAWIAAGPIDERVDLFRKNDAKARITADNDLRSIGEVVLDPCKRAQLTATCASVRGTYPNLPQRAEAADLYWKDHAEEFVEESKSRLSFRGMYRELYRYGSSLVHPTLLGMNRVTKSNFDLTRTIQMESVNEPPYVIGMTAVILGAALIVAEHSLDWPAVGSVDEVMARHYPALQSN